MEVLVNDGVGGCPLPVHSPNPAVWSDVRVLIVDSDMQNVMNLKWMFEQCGYNNIAYLHTAEDALWLLGHAPPVDLLICEAFLLPTTDNIGGGGGFQLLSAVRQDFKLRDVQVVLYSSNHDVLGLGHEMGIRALELGASAFYTNPISMEVVRQLWQHVFLKKIQSCTNYQIIPPQPIQNVVVETPESCCTNNNNSDVSENPKKKKSDKDDGVELVMKKSKRMNKKKERMRWTEDLERKFVAAVDEIRRSDPNGVTASRIRNLMKGVGEEGLSIPQINSHLQKYHKQKTSLDPAPDGVASGGGEINQDSSVVLQEWSDADFQDLMIDS